jgi:ABC-2 type transport system permease protein
MIQPGTALWFARHEARLAWRDWIAMMTAGRRERRWKVAIGFAVFVILMHAVAYSVVGRFAGATADKPMLVAITASLLLSWLLMASQAMESMTRAFYARADLDLILASPVAVHRFFAVRIATVALSVALTALPLAVPFIDMLVVRGGWRWLGAYGVIAAMGAAAAAFAVVLTAALFHACGPKRTRLVAQVVAAVVGAVFVIGVQVAAILSYGTLSRGDVLRSSAVLALAPDVGSVAWWPARAVLGDGAALAALLLAGAVLLAGAIAIVAPRFADYTMAAAGAVGSAARHARPAVAFRQTSPRRALRRKEWTLLRRDPWLVSQTLMQMRYLVPPAVLLWRGFSSGGGAFNLLVPVLVMAAAQLAGGLAWLTISGEDAPDLVATAPIAAQRDPAREGRGGARHHRAGVRAARRRPRRGLAVARARHRNCDRDHRRRRDRDPALVPQPGQAQPVSPPPGVVAGRDLCRGVFLDRLGRGRGGRRRQPAAGGHAGAARPRRARWRPRPEPAPAGKRVVDVSTIRFVATVRADAVPSAVEARPELVAATSRRR